MLGGSTDDTVDTRETGARLLMIVRSLIVALTLVVVVMAGYGAYAATMTGGQLLDRAHPPAERIHQIQFDSVRRQLADQIPAGTRVFVAQPADAVGWNQRLVEFATMDNLVVVAERQDADLDISVAAAPGGVGVRLVVHRNR